jgi:putative restriction endonuclease
MKQESDSSRYGAPWAREESILAFELYCRIPFQRTKSNNPAVQELARVLGRTPASVARKLGNFGAFDPELRQKDISGLTHTSRLDRQVWDEFHADWNGLVWQANQIRQGKQHRVEMPSSLTQPSGPSEALRTTKQRVHQSFFRDAILSSYATTCCVTGLTIPECLIASHIIPWSADARFRTDPTNGLCLSATFDRLFDAGLMTVTLDLLVRFSSRITESKSRVEEDLICRYSNRPIKRPQRFLPSVEHLAWRHANRFKH